MNVQDLVPSASDPTVISFCESLCSGQKPLCVPVHPVAGFLPRMCFQNVAEKVQVSGGGVVYGWDISQVPKVYLEAQFHAIWQSPSGKLACVTPGDIPQPWILFLRDVHHTYTGLEVPHQRMSLSSENKLVGQLWAMLDQKVEILKSLKLGGFQPGHPVYRHRLEGLHAEIVSLRKRIQNAG
jgi:hypothetical protein